jgi:cytidylate kinase
MINFVSSSGKSTLKKSLYAGSEFLINENGNSYRAYEEDILEQISKLADKFPKKNVKELKGLIE